MTDLSTRIPHRYGLPWMVVGAAPPVRQQRDERLLPQLADCAVLYDECDENETAGALVY